MSLRNILPLLLCACASCVFFFLISRCGRPGWVFLFRPAKIPPSLSSLGFTGGFVIALITAFTVSQGWPWFQSATFQGTSPSKAPPPLFGAFFYGARTGVARRRDFDLRFFRPPSFLGSEISLGGFYCQKTRRALKIFKMRSKCCRDLAPCSFLVCVSPLCLYTNKRCF